MHTSSRTGALWLAGGALGLGVAMMVSRLRRAWSPAGKVAVITGGSRGLGLLLARKLGAAGARVAICARHEVALSRALDDLRAGGIDAIAIQCDVTVRTSVAAMVRLVKQRWSRIDLLINNAGVIQMGPWDNQNLEDFQQSWDTHVRGPLNTLWEIVPLMRSQGGGRIVNIASIGGRISIPHLIPYCVSKFALVGLSEGIAAEFARENIHVTTVSPGLMRTGSHRQALFKGDARSEFAWFSISGALPGISIDGDAAAESIIRGIRNGDSHVMLGWPARLASLVHELAPQWTIRGLGLVNNLLPASQPGGQQARRGAESQSALSPSVLTALSDRAAVLNNELD